jgi:iron(III) transport system substrate-binding protein
MDRCQCRIFVSATILSLLLVGNWVEAGEVRRGWEVEWRRVVEAAKREAGIVVHTSGSFGPVQTQAFQKIYPEIKIVNVIGRGGSPALRILAEQRAGRYLADVVSAGIGIAYPPLYSAKALDPLRPALVLPDVLDESKWWEGKHHYLDPERQYVFSFVGAVQQGGGFYNSNLVSPRDFKSLWDFVHPKWRGKIEARDIRTPGPGNDAMVFFYQHPELGPGFIRKLFGEMGITLFTDFRQSVDWLAQGKFAICFFCAIQEIAKARQQGLPVGRFGVMKEGAGISSLAGTLALVKNAPHPSAAKVFINWVLSREGQLALQREIVQASGEAPDSRRTDIPKDDILPENRRVEGVKYIDTESPERRDMTPIMKMLEELFAKAAKK